MVEFHNHHGLCGRRAAEREFVKIAGSTHGEGEGDAVMKGVYAVMKGVYAVMKAVYAVMKAVYAVMKEAMTLRLVLTK